MKTSPFNMAGRIRLRIVIFLIVFNAYHFCNAVGNSGTSFTSSDTLFRQDAKTDPKPLLPYWQEQLADALKAADKIRTIRCHNMLALGYFYDRNYETSVNFCFDALKLAAEFETEKADHLSPDQTNILIQYQADTWYLLADLYLKVNEISKARDHLAKALQLYQSINFDEGIGKTKNRLGIILISDNKIEDAITLFNFLIDFYKKNEDTLGFANSYSNLGVCYTHLKQWETAQDCYHHALTLYQKIGNKELEATAWFNLAIIQRNIGNIEKVLTYYQKAENCCKEDGFMMGLIRVNIDIAQYHFERRDLILSEKYLKIAYHFADSLKQDELLMKIYQHFCDLYTEKGDYESALFNYKKSMSIYQSRFLSDKDKLAEMQLRYEIEKREKENEFLQVQNRFQEYVLQTQINRRNLLIAFSLLLMILLLLVIGRYRYRVKTNKILHSQKVLLEEANRTKDKFMSIIAHDLRNPMMAMISLADALAENDDRLAQSQRFQIISSLQKSTHYLQNLLENLLMWAQTQSDRILFFPECLNLKQTVDNAIEQHYQQASAKKIMIQNQVQDQMMVFADANMVRFILRNLISNAIKFSESKGSIQVEAAETTDFVYVKIVDYGCGISQHDLPKLFNLEQTKTVGDGKNKGIGLGLALCKDFVTKHGGEIHVESKIGQGTTVKFSIKKRTNGTKDKSLDC